MTIQTKAATPQYRDNWDAIFKPKEKALSVPLRLVRTKWDPVKKDNVCRDCGGPVIIKYIATGHDHTDYSETYCTCSVPT